MRSPASDRGFTLIEVLVATTIAAILLLPLLHSFSTGVATATRTDAITQATLIAELTLENIGAAAPLTEGSAINRQQGRYHVTASVHRYSDGQQEPSTLPVAPYEIVVTVAWQDAASTRSVALRTLRLGPSSATEPRP